MTTLLTSIPCVSPPEHPSTPTAPRVSAVPEKSVYPSPAAPGRAPTPQSLRSAQAEDANLRMIRARHSQGQPLPQHLPLPRDPAFHEREEQWFPDPGPPKDRGGWENSKPCSYGTQKHPAPTTTSTPQTSQRPERPPTPQTTPTPTCTATPDTKPVGKNPAETPDTPVAATPSLQEIWLKISRFL